MQPAGGVSVVLGTRSAHAYESRHPAGALPQYWAIMWANAARVLRAPESHPSAVRAHPHSSTAASLVVVIIIIMGVGARDVRVRTGSVVALLLLLLSLLLLTSRTA